MAEQQLVNRPWLITGPVLADMERRARMGIRPTKTAMAAAIEARRVKTVGSVAVIPIIGPIFHRSSYYMDYFGGASIQGLRACFRQALADPEISAIVFDVDSPGGEVDGTPEFAAEVFAARGQKPIFSVVNTLQCSAGHYIGVQADEVIMSPSATVGSIGVWVLHQNWKGFFELMGVENTFIIAGDNKVDGNPYEPLSDEAKADLQTFVSDIHRDFLSAVGRARGGLTGKAIKDAYGQGKVYSARDAVKLGIVDRIGTFDDVVARLAGVKRPSNRRADADWRTELFADLPVVQELEASAAVDVLAIDVVSPEAELARLAAADRDYLDATLALRRHSPV